MKNAEHTFSDDRKTSDSQEHREISSFIKKEVPADTLNKGDTQLTNFTNRHGVVAVRKWKEKITCARCRKFVTLKKYLVDSYHTLQTALDAYIVVSGKKNNTFFVFFLINKLFKILKE